MSLAHSLSTTHFPFLARLTPEGRSELETLRPATVSAAKPLLRRGDRADGAYFVTKGALRVYYVTEEGREATLYRVEPGGTCVLALTAALADEPYPAWVDAGHVGASVVRVPQAVFTAALHREPALREFVFSALSGRVFELMRTLEEAGSASVAQRVARYLLRHADPEGVVRASQAGIAAELGSAREVVFRSLRALSDQGLVETGRARVRILDRAGLGVIAG
jgi:CRP/FNR family transcriptional regulator, anaerobic regulatory protein